LAGYLDNEVVVPYGHNQEMKETLWKNMLQEKKVNRHTSLTLILLMWRIE
jgi:hypothetical protein